MASPLPLDFGSYLDDRGREALLRRLVDRRLNQSSKRNAAEAWWTRWLALCAAYPAAKDLQSYQDILDEQYRY